MSPDHQESLGKVLAVLPSRSDASTLADEARAVLALVIEPPFGSEAETAISPCSPSWCPNCSVIVESIKSPYCREACREIAGFVRQMRSGVVVGSLLDPERQVALGQILWRILGGGLPLRNSLIDAKAMAQLMAKHGGQCAACGAPATTVDHLGSHCNRTSNLRPMCDRCARTKPFGAPELLARPEVEALRAELARRIGSPSPMRLCDDAESWDWRAYVAARKGLDGVLLRTKA